MKKAKYLSILALSLFLIGCGETTPTSSSSQSVSSISESSSSSSLVESSSSEETNSNESSSSSENATSSESSSSESSSSESSSEVDPYVNFIINFTDTTGNEFTSEQFFFDLQDSAGKYWTDVNQIPNNTSYSFESESKCPSWGTGPKYFYYTITITSGGEKLFEGTSVHNGSKYAPLTSIDGEITVGENDVVVDVVAIPDPVIEEEEDTRNKVLYTLQLQDPSNTYVLENDFSSRAIQGSDGTFYRNGEQCPEIDTYTFNLTSDTVGDFTVTVYCNDVQIAQTTSQYGGLAGWQFTTTGGDIKIIVTLD